MAILICRPKAFERDELDVMLREAHRPKVHDWLVNYVVKKSPHAEELRVAWSADPDPVVASAGWALTTERVAKKPEGLDLAGLLDVIEAAMKDAPGTPPVGDEPLPGPDRDRAPRIPRPRDQHR